ncbi:MAG: HDIG domain-containing metalloprotein [Planctomycetota bacterium]
MNVPFLTRSKAPRSGASAARSASTKAASGRTNGRVGAGGSKNGGGRPKSSGKTRNGRNGGKSAANETWRDALLVRRGLAARLLMAARACGAAVLAVRGWEPAQRTRLGDFADDGIAARVPFEVEDRTSTAGAQAAAREAVPPIFRHDPGRAAGLDALFRRQLSTLALSESWEQAPAPARAAFGLGVTETGDGRADAEQAARNRFQTVRSVLAGLPAEGDDRPAAPERIDVLTAQLRPLLDELAEIGTLTAEALQASGVTANDPILVLQPGQDLPAPESFRERSVTAETHTTQWLLTETDRLDVAWGEAPQLSALRGLVERWLIRSVPPSLTSDPTATEGARLAAEEAVEPVVTPFVRGQMLVGPGEVIDADAADLLAEEHAALVALSGADARMVRAVVVAGILAVLAGLIGAFVRRNEPRLIGEAGRLASYLGLVVASVALGRWLSFDPWRAEAVPVLICAMTFAVAYNQWLAGLTGLAVSAVVVFSTTADLGHLLVLSSAAAAAVLPLSKVPSRSTVIGVGFFAAAVYLAVSLCVGLVERQPLLVEWEDAFTVSRPALMNGLRGAGWCLLAGYFVAGSLPFIERSFGVVTDISLLEMSDVSHPLLQDLVRRAPGTYNHSIAMATIGETAADAIGANGLLLRVAAYYHDVGKMLKPHYFIENQTAEDRGRHDELAPAMSTLIIIGHVRDGVDLAKQHGLPQRIIDFIEQHHGTTLVKYFYHEAGKRAEAEPGHEGDAEESAFRYPGPKPQTREAGVMMLADAVESATRSLSEPTPSRIENLVKAITMDRLLDGQFDESSLTLREIRIVEESLVKSLIGMHHGRIKYPDQKV